VGPALSELASCLVGTWDLDLGFVEEMFLESTRTSMRREGVDGTVSGTRFSAVQTTTFAADGTFVVQMPMSMELTVVLFGVAVPTTYDAVSTGSGTWSADAATLMTAIDSSDIEQSMVRGGEPLDVTLGPLLLLPDEPTPVVCDASTATISVITEEPNAPESLVFTRQQ